MKLYIVYHNRWEMYEFTEDKVVYISRNKDKSERFMQEYSQRKHSEYCNHKFYIEEVETDKELTLNE